MLKVNKNECIACEVCITVCPTESIKINEDGVAEINNETCIECFECQNMCVQEAIDNED